MTRWTAADIPDQHGRTVIVTGANSGLGAEATRVLAGAGAKVIMACRDPSRARAVADRIDGDTQVHGLDLADLSSVRAFADGFDGDVDVLINNAGSWGCRRARRRTALSGTSVPITSARSR
jgi:NAD(P)-dependent dehydrogenase (short-subunit alcohol dehydrogenase family)